MNVLVTGDPERAHGQHQCMFSASSPQGGLSIGVTLADPETVAEIHRLVAPWLSTDEVVIASRLRPIAL